MTESEAITALTDLAELITSCMGVWISVTFGYLTVVYFLGAALTRLQCIAISVLYVTLATLFATPAIGYTDGWLRLYEREMTVLDHVWVFSHMQRFVKGLAFVFISATLISLYFMYDVRKRNRKWCA
jgi:hypothetical protein